MEKASIYILTFLGLLSLVIAEPVSCQTHMNPIGKLDSVGQNYVGTDRVNSGGGYNVGGYASGGSTQYNNGKDRVNGGGSFTIVENVNGGSTQYNNGKDRVNGGGGYIIVQNDNGGSTQYNNGKDRTNNDGGYTIVENVNGGNTQYNNGKDRVNSGGRYNTGVYGNGDSTQQNNGGDGKGTIIIRNNGGGSNTGDGNYRRFGNCVDQRGRTVPCRRRNGPNRRNPNVNVFEDGAVIDRIDNKVLTVYN